MERGREKLKYVFRNISFIKSATKSAAYPVHSKFNMPEVAIAGRSNVGKSSLLNHLFRSRGTGMVKVSATPGKTQLINFFNVDDSFVCVDLPGYGFAKVPDSVRKKWGPMIQEYLHGRENLKLVFFLIDIRRIPSDDDLAFLDWSARAGKNVVLVLTKVDKLTKSQIKKNTGKILEKFNCENLHYVHYSVTKNIGYNQLVGLMNEVLNEASDDIIE